MDSDPTDSPGNMDGTTEPDQKLRSGSDRVPERPDLPPQDLTAADTDPATASAEDDEEVRLPDLPDETSEETGDAIPEGRLAVGHAAIENAVRLAPTSPGVYRMLNAANDVLYVGKAKNVRKRLSSYARVSAPLPARILRMIAATVAVEIISTTTETEALLLEANLIKQLRPRFNVQLRDDKSFPYILISGDHWAPQILKHRGAQSRPGRYFGPFANAGAVNRTITALQRAFLIRSCTDGFFESRTRPCLLYQIRRCSGPCTGEIDFPGYTELVREANDFLSGRSHLVKKELAGEMEKASAELEFETAALYRDRLAALSAIQSQQGINPRTVEEADVFAIHQEGGYSCVEVFFFRTGQNWGNRAYFPRAEKTFTSEEVLASFLAQFYDDKPPPKLILLSHEIEESQLLADALSVKAGFKVEVTTPKRGEKKELITHALTNAREALGRRLADTATQSRLLQGMVTTLGLPQQLRRIEVYDNSHIQGTNAVGAMIVAGPDGFIKNQYRKFNIKSEGLTPGDDYAMMREVLQRRFKRLLNPPAEGDAKADSDQSQGGRRFVSAMARPRHHRRRARPAQCRPRDLRGTRVDPGLAAGGRQGPRPRCRPRNPVHAGPRGDQARAARPRAVFHPAAARRGASLRDRLAPQAAQKGHPRGRFAGDSRHRPVTETCLAASFRNVEGDRTGVDCRPRQGSRRQRRKRPQDFRVFPRAAQLDGGWRYNYVISPDHVPHPVDVSASAVLVRRMNIATTKAQSKGQPKSLSLPNILTYARIAAIPVVVGCVFAKSIMEGPLWLRWIALAVFIAAGVTDYLDGYYARIWDQQSAFGRMLDPIADKLLVASCLLMLAADNSIHGWTLWAAIVILCREILVSGLREYLAALRVSVPVTKLAKWKTTLQLVAIGFLIAGEAGEQILPATTLIGIVLLWMSALFTIYTGWDYFRAGIHHLIKEDEG